MKTDKTGGNSHLLDVCIIKIEPGLLFGIIDKSSVMFSVIRHNTNKPQFHSFGFFINGRVKKLEKQDMFRMVNFTRSINTNIYTNT